ncbi:HD domain-containing phosphohydrolase [Scandinavium lactucae]|uniref:Transporter substrate-binding domain-containing protein n=1 Tax=Scandinavium lactucae TaxID=3095028 RepID=A0ABU4QM29_9ENTR|nr:MULTISPECIES: HD domain-containing phosphohydrolase [unclassified Scandinavium]MDX6040301.1 transporter substrate-binding domain-containing protein [Scandinavium sp. V105_6]MDX6051028.1 transporter substrate-binding domain-containing protein [Scandinavium sp. V105_1]
MRSVLTMSLTLLWVTLLSYAGFLRASPINTVAHPSPVPVWLFDADNFEFWRDGHGQYQGYYPTLIQEINKRYGYHLELKPIGGEEIGRRFNSNSYGLYAGVIKTNARAQSKILSARLFDIEVLAASLDRTAAVPEDLNYTRVIFRKDDATRDQVLQHYPFLHFRQRILVGSSTEAFTMLRNRKADFYINDDSEMDDPQHYYTLSRPFSDLRLPSVMGFSPELRGMRDNINQLIGEWQQSGKLNALENQSKRDYLVSRINITPEETAWMRNNRLTLWLPKNENFAPLLWQDSHGYHGTVMDMISDMRDLLPIQLDVKYTEDYVSHLRQDAWPMRMVNIVKSGDESQAEGIIGPALSWHNAYYNRIDDPFLWDEEQVRYKRVGVIRGSFSALYLHQRFGTDVTLLPAASIEELINAIEQHKIDFILGDLSSLEGSLRGNDLFRGVLKVAGLTRSDYKIVSWVDGQHPLHSLLTQIHRISSYRTQMERHPDASTLPDFSKNTFKIISIVLFISVLFSLCLLWLMWRQMKQSQAVSRSIVEAMEKVNRAHDDETGSHIQRVSAYCGLLARDIGLPRKMVQEIERYASLHDVGKIAVPERILRKQGPLTEEEFNEMKLHTLKGWRIIQGLGLGPVAENIIHYHHEKWDGNGYPEGLRGEQIPIEARILALADVYDALRQKRVYKPGYSHEHACSLIIAGTGRHFDPELINRFRQLHPKFQAIYDSRAD